ncbi:hypothetical protein niasHT_039445 [Heterodera trifolii]|uniref:Uncharacterized protein n=1 Tax=Heterodera trifolii TaxID=157864 RepID=A0ABD2IEA8_9BILA
MNKKRRFVCMDTKTFVYLAASVGFLLNIVFELLEGPAVAKTVFRWRTSATTRSNSAFTSIRQCLSTSADVLISLLPMGHSPCLDSLLPLSFPFPLLTNLSFSTGHFLHITDVHIDPNYDLSGDPQKWCHGSGDSRNKSPKLGVFGDHNCDSPMKFLLGCAFYGASLSCCFRAILVGQQRAIFQSLGHNHPPITVEGFLDVSVNIELKATEWDALLVARLVRRSLPTAPFSQRHNWGTVFGV